MLKRIYFLAIAMCFSGLITAIGWTQESVFLDTIEALRFHGYEGEELAILSAGTMENRVTEVNGLFTRTSYDKNYRVVSRLTWSTQPETEATFVLDNPFLLQENFYHYENSGICQRSVTIDYKNNQQTEKEYTETGLLSRETLYVYREPESIENQPVTKEQDKDSKNSNDAMGVQYPRKERLTEFFYNAENKLTGKKETLFTADTSFVYETKYHNPGNEFQGYDYYENGELKLTRRYSDADSYKETVFLPGNYRIEATYRGAKLLSEVTYANDIEVRRVEY